MLLLVVVVLVALLGRVLHVGLALVARSFREINDNDARVAILCVVRKVVLFAEFNHCGFQLGNMVLRVNTFTDNPGKKKKKKIMLAGDT